MTKPVMPYANNKDADQPAHPLSQISGFVVLAVDSTIPINSIDNISRLLLAFVAGQTGLSLTWSHTSEDRF